MAFTPKHSRFIVQGNNAKLWFCRDPEVMVEGPAGSGKTRNILERFWFLGNKYPGTRILLCRLERTRITRTVLRTFEDFVVPVGHPCLNGPSREYRKSYKLPNGTEFLVQGAEDPKVLRSMECDAAFWNEIVELQHHEPWEELHRALRSGPLPFKQLVCDTNPDRPSHWSLKRCERGFMRRIITTLKDNPRYYDEATRDWTPEGREYRDRLGSRLTGTRRRRLFEGQWCVSEGLLLPEFSEAEHMIARPPELEHTEGRVRYAWDKLCLNDGSPVRIRWWAAGMDFGTRKPGCLTVFGFDDSRRAFRVAEIYQPGKSPDWWADRIVDLMREFNAPGCPFRAVIADHAEAAPGGQIDTMNRRLGIAGLPRIVRPCIKDYEAAVGVIRDSLNPTDPRLFLMRGATRYGRPEEVDERGLPCSLEEELLGLVYPDQIDKPHRAKDEQHDPACEDHAFDAARYVLDWAWLRDLSAEAQRPIVREYKPGTWGHVMGHTDSMREAEEAFGA